MCPKVGPVSIRLGKHSNMLWGRQPTAFFFGFNSTKFSIILARFLLHVFYKKKIQLVDFVFNQANTVSKLFLVIYALFYKKKRYHIPLGSFFSFFFFYFKKKRRHIYGERRRFLDPRFYTKVYFPTFKYRQQPRIATAIDFSFYKKSKPFSLFSKLESTHSTLKLAPYFRFKPQSSSRRKLLFKPNNYKSIYRHELLTFLTYNKKYLKENWSIIYYKHMYAPLHWYFKDSLHPLRSVGKIRRNCFEKPRSKAIKFLNVFRSFLRNSMYFYRRKRGAYLSYVKYLKKNLRIIRYNNWRIAKALKKKKALALSKDLCNDKKSVRLKKTRPVKFFSKRRAYLLVEHFENSDPRRLVEKGDVKNLVLAYYKKNLYGFILSKYKNFFYKYYAVYYEYLRKKKSFFSQNFFFTSLLI